MLVNMDRVQEYALHSDESVSCSDGISYEGNDSFTMNFWLTAFDATLEFCIQPPPTHEDLDNNARRHV
jgi:hypothetical protein